MNMSRSVTCGCNVNMICVVSESITKSNFHKILMIDIITITISIISITYYYNY